MIRLTTNFIAMFLTLMAFAQTSETIPILEGESWYGAVTTQGVRMPYREMTDYIDLHSNYGNQTVPFLVSNKGRYIWSEAPFSFRFGKNEISILPDAEIIVHQAGNSLRSAFKAAASEFFTPSGEIPAELFMSVPQYNTWIELVYNQNQEDILKYAHAIRDNGFPEGVIIIDDNWQKYYGNFDFKPETFPVPKKMCDELHQMNFKVMLWICPYVSPDSPEYRFLRSKGYLIKEKNSSEPFIFDWWNGKSACYDLSNPKAYDYLHSILKKLQEEYGIDGFKFDAGDATVYHEDRIRVFDGKSNGPGQSSLWARMGTEFKYNEYRACWKMGGQPLVQRLRDKKYDWNALQRLVSDMLALGLLGHPYGCPDMVGGGEFKSFENVTPENVDQELIVRSTQVHALMPMMQFSVAPWRILDAEHLEIVRKYALLHQEYGDYILEFAHHAAQTGEPIIRHMEYQFPGQGLENCKDQFMLGDRLLVAPILTRDHVRTVRLPKGFWTDDLGRKFRGPGTITVEADLDRLPRYVKK